MALARSTARRYAEAAFEIAERDDSMEAWLAAFVIADERLASAEVMRLLANPSVPTATRVAALDRILGDDVTGAPRNLLVLMVRRGRFELLPGVIREFTRLYRRREGIVEASVTSAAALDAAEVELLQERLLTMTGSKVELQQHVDPELLGGIQVRVGDRLIDGSVRGRLERLRSEFSTIAI
jgi:F-type H+-transporting ATPase subunit delta